MGWIVFHQKYVPYTFHPWILPFSTPWFQFRGEVADKRTMKVTGTLPTPIPAREAISPFAKKKASGKIFDLMMEGQLLGKTQTTQAKDRLGEYLQNPTLAQYFLTWFSGR